MKIVVAGLGGVGGIIGGHLAMILEKSLEHEVVFWCRGAMLDKIRSGGLKLIGPDGTERIARPALATHSAEEAGKADAVIFAVKNYGLEAAAREIAPIIKDDTCVIPLLNGVSAHRVLEAALPACDVLRGCIYISGQIVEPGVVKHVGNVCNVFFGRPDISLDENRARYGAIETLMKDSGTNAVITDGIDAEMWSKFLFLSPMAAMTTLNMTSIDKILDDAQHMVRLQSLIAEAESLARACGVDLPQDIAEKTIAKSRMFPAGTKTSMLVDRENGRQTEIDALVGYVCAEAKAKGVSVPAYDAVFAELKAALKL